MAFATFCLLLPFLFFVEATYDFNLIWEYDICSTAAICAAKARNYSESKANLLSQIKNNTEFLLNISSSYFSEDETIQKGKDFGKQGKYFRTLINKYEEDFADIENKFQVKMQILNETRTIKNIIETEKSKLKQYQDSRLEVMFKFSKVRFDNFLFDIFPQASDYDRMIKSNDCGDCNPNEYFTHVYCLEDIFNRIKKGLDEQQTFIKSYVKEIETLDKTKRWYFINNARAASKSAFKILNRTITTKQVYDYYRPKLVPVYNEFVGRSDNLTSDGNVIKNIVQFVLDKLKDKEDRKGDCDYVNSMKDVIDTINTYLSPYTKFPIWSLEDFATKYIRPISNIKDVDRLINVLEDAFRASKKDILSKTQDLEDYAKSISTSVNRLYELMKNKNCSMIDDIQNISFGAYRTIKCVKDMLETNTPDIIELYLKTGRGADAIRQCYITIA